MRFAHLSDLHLGKRVCEFSMLDDQRYILEQILSLLDSTPVDGVPLMANTGSCRSASWVKNQSSRRTASAGGTGLS